MTPALNPLVLSLKESATLAINVKALELRGEGKEVFHFGFGQSPFPVPETIQAGLREYAHKNEYLPTQGLPELCDSVGEFYNNQFELPFTGKNVCIGPGSKELIFQVIYLVEGSLLVPAPSWVSYGPQAALRGKEIVPIPTLRHNHYKLTATELDKACHNLGQKQKLLILNNPNNPTGAVYEEEEIKEIAEICRAYEVIVISDEIYAMIDFTGKGQVSIAQYYPEGTIVTGGISKSFSAGGYRLGVMLIPDDLSIIMHALKAVVSETFSAVSAPIQYAALRAYRDFNQVEPFIKKTSSIFEISSGYLCKRFKDMGLNCPDPKGSFYLFPDFDNFSGKLRSKGVYTGKQLVESLLQEAHVAVLPGSDFYLPATSLGVRVASVDFDGADVLEKWEPCTLEDETKINKYFPNLVKGCDSLESYLSKI